MRNAAIVAALVSSLALTPTLAAGQSNNGNYWRTLDARSRIMYVMGFRDAMASCTAFATPRLNGGSVASNEQCRVLLGIGNNKGIGLVLRVTPQQLQDALDEVYVDAANRFILISRALGVVFMRLTGSSDEEVREMLEFERAMASGTVRPPA